MHGKKRNFRNLYATKIFDQPGKTIPTAIKAISGLVNAGILVEATGCRRDRAYSFEVYVNILRTGTESTK